MSSSVIFFMLFISTLTYSSEIVVHVNGVNGHDDSNCLQPHGHPCQSLEYVQQNVKSVANHSVVIEICNPGINLTAALIFEDIVGLSIRGSRSMNKTTINCNTFYSGLSFFNITGLSLSFLKLTNCGTMEQNLTLTSALYIVNCTNVSIRNSSLRNSNGRGISLLYTNGQVVIDNTDILDSFVRNESSNFVFGGGGLFIKFTKCTSSLVSNSCGSDEGHNSNAMYMYTIRNCNLSQNVVNANTNSDTQQKHDGYSNTKCCHLSCTPFHV